MSSDQWAGGADQDPPSSKRRRSTLALVADVDGDGALLPHAGGACPVGEDVEDPGLERGAALEAVDALQDGEPGLLGDLLRDGPAGDEGLGEPDHGRVVGVDELGEGGLVPVAQPSHEVVISHARSVGRAPSGCSPRPRAPTVGDLGAAAR